MQIQIFYGKRDFIATPELCNSLLEQIFNVIDVEVVSMSDDEITSLISIANSYDVLYSCIISYASMYWFIAHRLNDCDLESLAKVERFTRIVASVVSEMPEKADDITYFEFALYFIRGRFEELGLIEQEELACDVAKYIAIINQEIKSEGDNHVKCH